MVVTWVRNRGKEKMRIKVSECTGLVIDMQERLFPVMFNSDQLLPRVQILVEGLKVLKIPMLVTEQYPNWAAPKSSKSLAFRAAGSLALFLPWKSWGSQGL